MHINLQWKYIHCTNIYIEEVQEMLNECNLAHLALHDSALLSIIQCDPSKKCRLMMGRAFGAPTWLWRSTSFVHLPWSVQIAMTMKTSSPDDDFLVPWNGVAPHFRTPGGKLKSGRRGGRARNPLMIVNYTSTFVFRVRYIALQMYQHLENIWINQEL